NSIFKKFYRVKHQFNQQGSIGLGLAFCKEITEFMGGEIRVDSQLNVGTTFVLTFPVLSTTVIFMDREIKVAVIEDDENLRFLVSHRLQTAGYTVLQSGNGIEAEQLIISESPDIVLLDWMLPGKEGIDVCQAVRNGGFENIIIMMTAKSQDIDKIDAYSYGVSDYITKPFNIDVLVAMIENKVRFFVPKNNKDVYTFGD